MCVRQWRLLGGGAVTFNTHKPKLVTFYHQLTDPTFSLVIMNGCTLNEAHIVFWTYIMSSKVRLDQKWNVIIISWLETLNPALTEFKNRLCSDKLLWEINHFLIYSSSHKEETSQAYRYSIATYTEFHSLQGPRARDTITSKVIAQPRREGPPEVKE